ncbi:MAG: hypothetical protein ABI808_05000 [Pseudonocardiales bacterium]
MIAQPAIKRRIGIGLVAVCAALLTSACAAGQQAQTGKIVPAVDATNGTIGDLQLYNVAIHSPNGPSYQAGDAAELQLVIVNVGHAADTLTNISSPAASGYQVFATAAEASAAASPSASSSPSDTASGSTSASGSGSASGSTSASGSSSAAAPTPPTALQIPPDESLRLSITSDTAVLLVKLSKALFPGTSVPITFTFASAGSVTLTVPVQITLSGGSAGLTIPPPSSSGAA